LPRLSLRGSTCHPRATDRPFRCPSEPTHSGTAPGILASAVASSGSSYEAIRNSGLKSRHVLYITSSRKRETFLTPEVMRLPEYGVTVAVRSLRELADWPWPPSIARGTG